MELLYSLPSNSCRSSREDDNPIFERTEKLGIKLNVNHRVVSLAGERGCKTTMAPNGGRRLLL